MCRVFRRTAARTDDLPVRTRVLLGVLEPRTSLSVLPATRRCADQVVLVEFVAAVILCYVEETFLFLVRVEFGMEMYQWPFRRY